MHPNAGKAAAANAKKAADSSMKEKRRSNPYTKSARPRSMPVHNLCHIHPQFWLQKLITLHVCARVPFLVLDHVVFLSRI